MKAASAAVEGAKVEERKQNEPCWQIVPVVKKKSPGTKVGSSCSENTTENASLQSM